MLILIIAEDGWVQMLRKFITIHFHQKELSNVKLDPNIAYVPDFIDKGDIQAEIIYPIF